MTIHSCENCEKLFQILSDVEKHVEKIEHRLGNFTTNETHLAKPREFYSVLEFAELVGKSEYTVREWCRLNRINAEKTASGHGDSKAWKIPADELNRYLDHGLLPDYRFNPCR